MTIDIQIQKTTILLVLGLLAAVVAGAFIISTAPSALQDVRDGAANAGNATIAAAQNLQNQASRLAPARGAGCGCGIGGSGGEAAQPDPSKAVLVNSTDATVQGEVQEIYIRAKNDGTYDTQQVTVKAGEPVRLHFSADPDAGCGRQMVIYGLGIRAVSQSGEEQVVEFVPKEPGSYEYNCGMRMWRAGRLVVV